MKHFIEYPLQYMALAWMAALYSIKIYPLSRLPVPWEKAPPKGSAGRGAVRAYTSAFMPWAMESSRRHVGRWAEFWLYHLGVASALLATFALPFTPSLMTHTVKVARRLTRPEPRLVSTLDDYFALITMEVFFASGLLALLTDASGWRTTYFAVTAALIFYVPFSTRP